MEERNRDPECYSSAANHKEDAADLCKTAVINPNREYLPEGSLAALLARKTVFHSQIHHPILATISDRFSVLLGNSLAVSYRRGDSIASSLRLISRFLIGSSIPV